MYFSRGNVRRAKGDLDGALADFAKCIELKPDFALPYINRCNAELVKGDWDGALADCAKAILVNPRLAGPYHIRGCLRYGARDFTNALLDFRKELELEPSSEYARFRVWLTRARLGEARAASTELQTYLGARTTGKPDDWASKIGWFLAGQLEEPEFLAAAKNAGQEPADVRLCEAYFYAGSKRLSPATTPQPTIISKNPSPRAKKDHLEYTSAAEKLKSLKAQKN